MFDWVRFNMIVYVPVYLSMLLTVRLCKDEMKNKIMWKWKNIVVGILYLLYELSCRVMSLPSLIKKTIFYCENKIRMLR